MNRAEKRRLKKNTKKATTKKHVESPITLSPGKQALSIQDLISVALQHHAAGNLSTAKDILQEILRVVPHQPTALHLLGIIAHQMDENYVAVDLLRRALVEKPDFTEAHYNLGIVLQNQGKLDEAIIHLKKAITINPEFADAHNYLGNVLKDQGNIDGAIVNYQRAIAINPAFTEALYNLGNAFQIQGLLKEALAHLQQAISISPGFSEAHNNLGNTLHDLGRSKEAIKSYQKALNINPGFVEALNNLGSALHDQQRLKEAVVSYQKALAINPELAEAHNNLGNTFQEMGMLENAFACHRRAISLNPKNMIFWVGFASSLEKISFTFVDDTLLSDLLKLLDLAIVRPNRVAAPILSALRCQQGFLKIIEDTSSKDQNFIIPYEDLADKLSEIPLFLRLMAMGPIADIEIERMLLSLRRALLEETVKGGSVDIGLPFSSALALHCFTNEYVFPETKEEKYFINILEKKIDDLIIMGKIPDPYLLATLGSYRPLYNYSWGQELSRGKWKYPINSVIETQILQPLEEMYLRDKIPCLTPIRDNVSNSVRDQYEENPYPRWITTNVTGAGKSVKDSLQDACLWIDMENYSFPEKPEILIAGCGTGRHALGTASRFLDSKVLAIDLSLSSLAYAVRKTNESEITNITYAQADILELGSLDKKFDVIESVGVLHHLREPMVAWRILTDLLRPGGVMKIGLYSETARQDIVSGQSFLANRGYKSFSEDIRSCRQDIIALAESGDRRMKQICNRTDFYSLSEYRDLLFHVQEQRFSLPQIKDFLSSLNLKFLGFEMTNQNAMRKFRENNPDRIALTSLSKWHRFESENPDTFSEMYRFWCQAR